jgi:hypothetical protein
VAGVQHLLIAFDPEDLAFYPPLSISPRLIYRPIEKLGKMLGKPRTPQNL